MPARAEINLLSVVELRELGDAEYVIHSLLTIGGDKVGFDMRSKDGIVVGVYMDGTEVDKYRYSEVA